MNNGSTYGTREPKSERAYIHEIADVIDAIEANEARQWAASIEAGSEYYPHCISGPCQGGKKLCPSPDSCRITQRATPNVTWLWWTGVIVLGVLLVLAVRWYR